MTPDELVEKVIAALCEVPIMCGTYGLEGDDSLPDLARSAILAVLEGVRTPSAAQVAVGAREITASVSRDASPDEREDDAGDAFTAMIDHLIASMKEA